MNAVTKPDATALAERTEPPVNMMEVIARAAADPNTDVDKLERLMAMAERVKAKEAEQAFNAAMTAAQKEMGRVSADATNPQTHSKYASYPALDKAVRPIYTRHGFALSFDEGDCDKPDHIRVLCHVSHQNGHTRTYRKDIPADGKGAKGGDVMTKTHASGAADTYGMRYLLKKIFNIAVGEDDDDGNAATGGVEPITDDMMEELQGLLGQCNGDPELFCKYMKVEAMAEIKQKDIGKAREALNTAINKYQREKSAKTGGAK